MPHRRELAAPSSLPRGPITYATNCYESYREAMTVTMRNALARGRFARLPLPGGNAWALRRALALL